MDPSVGPATTIYAKREEPSADPSSSILAQCGNAASRVSSACSCILSTTSTVTVVETVTATEAAEATITTTEVITTGVVATQSATPTVTVTNPIVNGAFESYVTTNNILPWASSASQGTDGKLDILSPLSVCDTMGYCPGGQVIIRAYPPKAAGTYWSIRQDSFTAKPSTTYKVSFLYRCLNYDSTSGIDVYFKGAYVGGNKCANGNFNHITSGIQFTTDQTGTGSLEFRFMNPSGLQYLYYYADDFQAKSI